MPRSITAEFNRMPSYAVVLSGPIVNESAVAAIEQHLTGVNKGECIWLAPGSACEWHIEGAPEAARAQLASIRAEAAAASLDANLIPLNAQRRKKLLIADMDSTIIQQECIDELADFAGHGPAVAEITERAMRGELDFEDALNTRVALLKGLDIGTLERVVAERLTLTPGARTLVATMSANGGYCALVSGGFTFFTSRIAVQVGFDENRANTLDIANGHLTGTVTPPILGRQAKLDAMRDIISTRNIAPSLTLAVGDGANDLTMLKEASLGVAFHAKPVVADEADAQVNHGDLTTLLYLQGYHQHQFADI